VVGTDGSDTAGQAVRAAGLLSLGSRGCVHVVSAYQPRALARVGHVAVAGPEAFASEAEIEMEVETLLREAASTLEAMGAQVECHARAGDPAAAILDIAENEGADLIVVGNKGMRGVKRFLLGSVPEKVSHHAPCSVMIVRTV
jgi:nucleotide-binding universal stress UspA family protein